MVLDESRIALSLLQGIGTKTLTNLLAHFESCDAILEANAKDLKQVRGIGQKIADAITSIDMDAVRHDIEKWQHLGVHILPYNSDDYPLILRDLDDAPLVLFAKGQYQPEKWQKAVAIVGTRKPSPQAQSVAGQLGEYYAQNGWTVVSGLALGIDTLAHQGALKARSSQTIAITGGGILNIYPTENQALAEAIMAEGAILCENEPYANATAPRLVMRNRLISGFCQRVIVVQSDVKGGAMHAARATYKQGRAIYTIDWKQFSGNQALLKNGATPLDLHEHDIVDFS